MRSYRYADEYDFGPVKHSGPGLTSFILALAAGALNAVMFVIALAIENERPGAMGPGNPETAVIGLGMCLGLFSALVGVGLGIAGVCQHRRRIIFAVLG